MQNDRSLDTPLSVAERKQALIAQGAVFRTQLLGARNIAQESLRSATFAKNTMNQVLMAALSLFQKNKKEGGLFAIGLQVVLPLVMRGVSILSKKPLPPSLLRNTFILGTLGTVAIWMANRKKARSCSENSKSTD